MAKMMNPTKVVTGVCRFSYANLWEPKAMDENSKAKYSVSLIIPKSDTKTLDKIRQQSRQHMRKAGTNSATASLYRLSQHSKRLSVTATWNVLMMRLTQTATL